MTAEPVDRREWEEVETYVLNHPQGSVFHLPGWYNALERENGRPVVCLCCRDYNRCIRGIFPLLGTRGLPFGIGKTAGSRRLSSLPRTPFCGPLADDKKTADLLIEKAMAISTRDSVATLQYKSMDGTLLPDGGMVHRVVWRKSLVKIFPEPGERLTFGNPRNNGRIENGIRKAVRSGISIAELVDREELPVWYRLYVQTMRRHLIPARSLRFFLSLWDNFHAKKHMKIICARKENTLIAGSIFLLFNDRAFYAFNGSNYRFRTLRANDAILWHFQQNAHHKGFRHLDLGEVADGNDGLFAFKHKWGVVERTIYHYYYPAAVQHQDTRGGGRLDTVLATIWKHVPAPVTEFAGAIINRYL